MERPKEEPGRRVGNTTRLIDYYIQKLFKEGKIFVADHYPSFNADRHLANKICDRMKLEHIGHPIERLIKNRTIVIKFKDND